MSHKRMVETEALLQQRIAELLAQAGTVDTAEQSEPELDILAGIVRREDRPKVTRQRASAW